MHIDSIINSFKEDMRIWDIDCTVPDSIVTKLIKNRIADFNDPKEAQTYISILELVDLDSTLIDLYPITQELKSKIKKNIRDLSGIVNIQRGNRKIKIYYA